MIASSGRKASVQASNVPCCAALLGNLHSFCGTQDRMMHRWTSFAVCTTTESASPMQWACWSWSACAMQMSTCQAMTRLLVYLEESCVQISTRTAVRINLNSSPEQAMKAYTDQYLIRGVDSPTFLMGIFETSSMSAARYETTSYADDTDTSTSVV